MQRGNGWKSFCKRLRGDLWTILVFTSSKNRNKLGLDDLAVDSPRDQDVGIGFVGVLLECEAGNVVARTVVPFCLELPHARPVLGPHVIASLCGAAVPAASSCACPAWWLLVGAPGSAVLPQPVGCLAAVVAALTVRGLLDGRRPRDGPRVVAEHSL